MRFVAFKSKKLACSFIGLCSLLGGWNSVSLLNMANEAMASDLGKVNWPFYKEDPWESGSQEKQIVLRSTDSSRIYLSYKIENRAPNEMGGTTKMVTGLTVQVGGKWAAFRAGRERVQNVRAVLVNTCKAAWMDQPKVTTLVVDLQPLDITETSSGSFGLNGVAIPTEESPAYTAEFGEFEGFSTGYRFDTMCTQEISLVHNGNWLKDPVSQTHNFKFAAIHIKDDSDPLAAWIEPHAGVELISADAWQRSEGSYVMRALLRVKNYSYNKAVGLAFEKISAGVGDGELQKEWSEQYATYVGPLSEDTELWEVEITDQLSLKYGTQFAAFYKKSEFEHWDTNCGMNYSVGPLAASGPSGVHISGRASTCSN